jgi:hypothetical protein
MTAQRTAEFETAQDFTFDFCALRFDLLMPFRQPKDGNARATKCPVSRRADRAWTVEIARSNPAGVAMS